MQPLDPHVGISSLARLGDLADSGCAGAAESLRESPLAAKTKKIILYLSANLPRIHYQLSTVSHWFCSCALLSRKSFCETQQLPIPPILNIRCKFAEIR